MKNLNPFLILLMACAIGYRPNFLYGMGTLPSFDSLVQQIKQNEISEELRDLTADTVIRVVDLYGYLLSNCTSEPFLDRFSDLKRLNRCSNGDMGNLIDLYRTLHKSGGHVSLTRNIAFNAIITSLGLLDAMGPVLLPSQEYAFLLKARTQGVLYSVTNMEDPAACEHDECRVFELDLEDPSHKIAWEYFKVRKEIIQNLGSFFSSQYEGLFTLSYFNQISRGNKENVYLTVLYIKDCLLRIGVSDNSFDGIHWPQSTFMGMPHRLTLLTDYCPDSARSPRIALQRYFFEKQTSGSSSLIRIYSLQRENTFIYHEESLSGLFIDTRGRGAPQVTSGQMLTGIMVYLPLNHQVSGQTVLLTEQSASGSQDPSILAYEAEQKKKYELAKILLNGGASERFSLSATSHNNSVRILKLPRLEDQREKDLFLCLALGVWIETLKEKLSLLPKGHSYQLPALTESDPEAKGGPALNRMALQETIQNLTQSLTFWQAKWLLGCHDSSPESKQILEREAEELRGFLEENRASQAYLLPCVEVPLLGRAESAVPGSTQSATSTSSSTQDSAFAPPVAAAKAYPQPKPKPHKNPQPKAKSKTHGKQAKRRSETPAERNDRIRQTIEDQVKKSAREGDWKTFEGFRQGLKELARRQGALWHIKNDKKPESGKGSHKGLQVQDEVGNTYKMIYPDHSSREIGKGLVGRLVGEVTDLFCQIKTKTAPSSS